MTEPKTGLCDGHRDRFICTNPPVHQVAASTHPETGEIFYDHYCEECYQFLFADKRVLKRCPQCETDQPEDEFQFVEDQEICADCRAKRYLDRAAPVAPDEGLDPEHQSDHRDDDEDDEDDEVDDDVDSDSDD